ncbi:Dam family site-specific DNA-(adenine-N6)-methyltransferase [Corynebacterium sp. c8Ua_99]|uniref:Dam family site-specific DNA-(adenine-N6)-methyltransferase n=1 Tax=Corynebacterium sp. c8Ua_99 TaxID=3032335 RepID=UPI003262ED79
MRYIGSKVALLDNISEILERNLDGDEKTFLDIFAGTNSVAEYFKPRYEVITNDLLAFSYANAVARIQLNQQPTFAKLAEIGIKDPIDFLQRGAEDYLGANNVGYYESNYSPTGGAMYLSVENAKRVDFIRDKISEWEKNKRVSEEENFYLIDALLSGIPSVSNTTGTYGAYLKKWDKRALKPLVLRPSRPIDNQRQNKCYNIDANILVRELSTDIAYIDPPYNSRQYGSNYHVLENIANNDKPELKGVTRLFDWSNLKSDYCVKNKVFNAMRDLLNNIDAKHVVLSYNSEGILSESDLRNLAKSASVDGKVDIVHIPYRKYKSKIASQKDELYEVLIYFRKRKSSIDVLGPDSPRGVDSKLISCDLVSNGNYIKSPLNYIGGKYRLLGQIMPLIPTSNVGFVDLFSGGANVGINANADWYVFNDMNSRINEMFRLFQTSSPRTLLRQIHNTIEKWELSKTNEGAFLAFRDYYNKRPDPLNLYILSSFSYNYQFRFNSKLEFNNPFGRNRSHFSTNMERNLLRFVNRLQSIDAYFEDAYFEDFDYSRLSPSDFVYMDPPYLITTGSYNDGNRGFRNWNEKSEAALLDVIEELTERGVPCALSNVLEHKGKRNILLADFIYQRGLHVHELKFHYDNSSHNSKLRGSREVLITNYQLDDNGRAVVDI